MQGQGNNMGRYSFAVTDFHRLPICQFRRRTTKADQLQTGHMFSAFRWPAIDADGPRCSRVASSAGSWSIF